MIALILLAIAYTAIGLVCSYYAADSVCAIAEGNLPLTIIGCAAVAQFWPVVPVVVVGYWFWLLAQFEETEA